MVLRGGNLQKWCHKSPPYTAALSVRVIPLQQKLFVFGPFTLPLLPVRAWCFSIASRHHLGSRSKIFTWLGNCHHGGLENPASRILRIMFLSVETAQTMVFWASVSKDKILPLIPTNRHKIWHVWRVRLKHPWNKQTSAPRCCAFCITFLPSWHKIWFWEWWHVHTVD